MTQLEKDQRKALIKERNEGYAIYWLTRSSRSGILSDSIDVWTDRPTRIVHGEIVYWTSPGNYWGKWTLAQAYSQVRSGIPEDDRQCTKNG